MLLRDPDTVPMYQCTNSGHSRATLANRLSYFFDLHGPSVTIDTACSASLVSLHLGCQSLRTGDAKCAIVAGANVILSHEIMIAMSMMRYGKDTCLPSSKVAVSTDVGQIHVSRWAVLHFR